MVSCHISDADSEFYRLFWNALVYQFVKHYNIETMLDQQIPVIPWTIVIYFGCYLVWIVNYLIAASREKEFVWRFFAADVLARLVCMAFYLLPTTNVAGDPEQDSGIRCLRCSLPDGCGGQFVSHRFTA